MSSMASNLIPVEGSNAEVVQVFAGAGSVSFLTPVMELRSDV